ncbi:MAG: hypothetical protein WAN59_11350 [Candidatus Baltobacteraceae bacterium]
MVTGKKRVGVSFDDAYRLFVDRGGPAARKVYDRWESRKDLRDAGVINFVKAFKHERLFAITRHEFDDVVKNTTHPLKQITPKNERDLKAIRLVENADVPWSFMQLFHGYVERDGLPTWQTFRMWIMGEGAPLLWAPYKEQLGFREADHATKQLIRDGTAWRLGNAYYSALREIDIIVSLGDAGLPVSYHLLADALFSVDFWRGNRFVSVYIENPQFKSLEGGGRKSRPEDIYRQPQFYCNDFEIQKQQVHGKYWPVAASTVAQIAAFLVRPEAEFKN